MDESELEEYLELIDQVEQKELERIHTQELLVDQLRDEHGFRVPGCYRVPPAPSEE